MAIYHISGKPGSGKTFWCVHHLLNKYYEYNKIHGEYFPRTNVSIVTNIDSLKLDHYNLDEMIAKSGGNGNFFTVEYQKDLLKRFSRIVYIIDEAGKYFPAGLKDDKIIFFFQYHRHLGVDFYLVSPGVSNVCANITRLAEYRLQASPRSKRITNEFRYRKIVEGDVAGRVVIGRDSKIFNMYRSMDQEEVEHVGSLARKYIVALVLFFVVGGFVFFLFIGKLKHMGSGNTPFVGYKKEVKAGGKVAASSGDSGGKTFEIISLPSSLLSVDPLSTGLGSGLSEFLQGWSRVQVMYRSDGRPLFVLPDGSLVPDELVGLLHKEARNVGGAIYVRRKPTSEGGEVRFAPAPVGSRFDEKGWKPLVPSSLGLPAKIGGGGGGGGGSGASPPP